MDSLPHQIAADERRTSRRTAIDSLAIVGSSDRSRTTRLVNISAGGALVGPVFGINPGDRTTLNVPGYGVISGRVVR
ncbi:MAG: PilZ domain-containing protein, partial [Alphaproteobacteria bacterium]